MTIWRGRQCRAAVALAQRAGALGLFAVAVLAVPAVAGAGEAGINDPRDVGNRLDLKTVTHAQDGRSIVYTAETYGQFSDQSAAFKWGVDRDRDERRRRERPVAPPCPSPLRSASRPAIR